MKAARVRLTSIVWLVSLIGGSLSACHKQADSDAVGNDRLGTETGLTEDKFGRGFGKAFRADPNSEPMNVSDGDMIPVSNTAEPIEVN